MKNIFIDSNIWLSLYAFSSDDLNQFMKLSDLIGTDINILLPEQVCDEVNRNRENKIRDAMNKFENWKLEIPNICKGYSQYADFLKKTKELEKFHREFALQIKKDITLKSLHADKAISSFFQQVTVLPRTDNIIVSAFRRYRIGNPPGKDSKHGDAINWITLLDHAPHGEDLFFIGADGDYQSVLDKNRFNQFLLDEWKLAKSADIYFFKSLTEFFSKHVKAIQLKNELIADQQKDALISDLACSYSFAETHNIIARMSKYNTWSDGQVRRIFDAVAQNSQVGMISGDDDVAGFLESISGDSELEMTDEESEN